MADPELRKRRPYGLYRHGDSAHPRPTHLAWNGTTLPLDDTWWATHTPSCGWGCKCKKFMLSARDGERQGLTIDPVPAIEWEERIIGKNSPNGPRTVRVPKGIDPGFEYAPGQSRLTNAVPQPRPRDPLPAMSATPATVPSPQAVTQFLSEFGATDTTPAIFRDVTGDTLMIGRAMFTDAKTGATALTQQIKDREQPLLAEAIKTPDEIWARQEWQPDLGKAVLRRHYLAHIQVKDKAAPAVAVFDQDGDSWTGATGFVDDSEQYLEALRIGVRLYRRTE